MALFNPKKSLENQTDEDDRVLNLFPESSAQALGRMILILMTGFVVTWIYNLLYGAGDILLFYFIVAIAILMGSYREFRARRIVRGLVLICWGTWVYAFSLSISVAGIRTPVLLIVPSLIMIIAWVQGKRAMLLMTILSILFVISLVVAERAHWLPPAVLRKSEQVMLVYLCVIAVSSVVALVLAENFKRLLEKGWRLTSELQASVSELTVSERALKDLNERLEQRVLERTAQFDEANKSLQKSVTRLELAQSELVNAEKLASLGSMVAGISHELNTPIGNVLMITSSMEKLYQEMQEKVVHGSVKRSDFEDFLKTGHEMSVLALRSTTRAAELVVSFKQVAADQTSEQRRTFDLKNVIEDNIATLWPSIKNRSVDLQIDNQIPAHIVCDSFPGPLGQVIINLTQNALLHGLADVAQGKITILGVEQENMVTVTVADNGCGIAPHILTHIFDPFFTTKLGKGGSGLGLTVSYRIVTSVLGGNMFATSSLGHGAQFTLVFPKTAPFKL